MLKLADKERRGTSTLFRQVLRRQASLSSPRGDPEIAAREGLLEGWRRKPESEEIIKRPRGKGGRITHLTQGNAVGRQKGPGFAGCHTAKCQGEKGKKLTRGDKRRSLGGERELKVFLELDDPLRTAPRKEIGTKRNGWNVKGEENF